MSKISFLIQKIFSSASVSPVSQCQPRQSVSVSSVKRVFCQPFSVLQMKFTSYRITLSNRFIKLFQFRSFSFASAFFRFVTLYQFIVLDLIKFDRSSSSSEMSEKQFEEKENRLFFKSLLKLRSRSLSQTRARTRSQTRSMIELESTSSNSKSALSASLSVTESDTTERDLARNIREQSVNNVLINQYVIRMFRTLFQNNIQDQKL